MLKFFHTAVATMLIICASAAPALADADITVGTGSFAVGSPITITASSSEDVSSENIKFTFSQGGAQLGSVDVGGVNPPGIMTVTFDPPGTEVSGTVSVTAANDGGSITASGSGSVAIIGLNYTFNSAGHATPSIIAAPSTGTTTAVVTMSDAISASSSVANDTPTISGGTWTWALDSIEMNPPSLTGYSTVSPANAPSLSSPVVSSNNAALNATASQQTPAGGYLFKYKATYNSFTVTGGGYTIAGLTATDPNPILVYLTVEPWATYDYHDLSGLALWDVFSPTIACNPVFDRHYNNGYVNVIPGDTIEIGFHNFVDQDTMKDSTTNGQYVEYDADDATYQITFTSNTGATFAGSAASITTTSSSPNVSGTLLTFADASTMPDIVAVQGAVNDQTPLPPTGDSGTADDPSGSTYWYFQKANNPPTIAREKQRATIPTGAYAGELAEIYEVGLPWTNGTDTQFDGWLVSEQFSNYNCTGFGATDMKPAWLAVNGLGSQSSNQAVAAALWNEVTTGGGEINSGEFVDQNWWSPNQDDFLTNVLQPQINFTLSAKQTFIVEGTIVLTDQITNQFSNGTVTVTKTY